MRYSLLFIIAITFLTYTSEAQIVNIESQRKITDTTGFAGSAGIEGSYFQNKDRIFRLTLNSDVQYKTEKKLFLLLGQYNRLQSNETNFNESAFLHFRLSNEFSELFRWETFTQVQYNKVNKINMRLLIGSGPRLKFLENKWLKIYMGVIPMYEYENLDSEENMENRDFRFSNYFSFTIKINDNARLASTTYFQPLIYQWSDHRILNENVLKIGISEKISLTVSYIHAYDSAPPVEVPETQVSSQLGLEYKF